MRRTLNDSDFKKFLTELSRRILQAKAELNSMDAECGDGDFGSTMATAFGEAGKALEETSSDDIGRILGLIGSSILSSAGGASGPTISALFTESGKEAKGQSEVDLECLASMFGKSVQRIKFLGGAKMGDKTLLDALEPAASALRRSAEAGKPLQDGLHEAVEAAERGCESTKGMIAKHGKAKFLGEQTLGFVDPGAYLVSLVLATLADTTRDS